MRRLRRGAHNRCAGKKRETSFLRLNLQIEITPFPRSWNILSFNANNVTQEFVSVCNLPSAVSQTLQKPVEDQQWEYISLTY